MEGRSTARAVVFWSIIALPILGCALIAAYGYFLYAYFVLNRWPSQEQMAPSGYQLIRQAREIDDLFGPAWHSVANYQDPDSAEWHTEAYFGGRYQLLMTVDVRVDRQSGGIIDVVGKPRFVLREIQAILGDREVSFRGSSEREFGVDKWRQLVEANGDFSAIGIPLTLNNPVPGFNRYLAQPRHGMRLSEPKEP